MFKAPKQRPVTASNEQPLRPSFAQVIRLLVSGQISGAGPLLAYSGPNRLVLIICLIACTVGAVVLISICTRLGFRGSVLPTEVIYDALCSIVFLTAVASALYLIVRLFKKPNIATLILATSLCGIPYVLGFLAYPLLSQQIVVYTPVVQIASTNQLTVLLLQNPFAIFCVLTAATLAVRILSIFFRQHAFSETFSWYGAIVVVLISLRLCAWIMH